MSQVQYSLLYRTPEKNGVMDACKEHNVTLVAYSPLCQGLLTGEWLGRDIIYESWAIIFMSHTRFPHVPVIRPGKTEL